MKAKLKLGKQTFGEKASPIIEDLASAIFEHDYHFHGEKPGYSLKAFVGAQEIFLDVLSDKMWEHAEELGLGQEEKLEIVGKAGSELRDFVMRYTGIDPGEALKQLYGGCVAE